MKYLKTIGILVSLSMSICVLSQNSTINSIDRSLRALNRLQEMLPESKIVDQQPVIDIDGNVYQTMKVGDDIWMAENLKVNHYRNGDSIANVTDSASWVNLTTGAWCDYNNNPTNGSRLGKLYNFYAVSDQRCIAPKGWHVASPNEWRNLRANLGKSQVEDDGDTWISIDDYSNKMNLKLSAGVRTYENFYDYDNTMSRYWTTYEVSEGNGAYREEYQYESGILLTNGDKWAEKNKYHGYSVRCVKDKPVVKPAVTKKVYKKKR